MRYYLFIILFISLGASHASVHATEKHLNFVDKAESAKFGTSNIEPYGYINKNNQQAGLLIKFNEALEAESGTTINNTITPYPRVISNLEHGVIDFAVMFNSPEAKRIGISVGHLLNSRVILVALKGSPSIKSLDDLAGKPVAYFRGSKYGPVFDNNTSIKKVSIDSLEQAIKMLEKKHIQALATIEHTLYYGLKKLDIDHKSVRTIMEINQTKADLYFSKKSPNTHLITPMREALKRMHAKGTIEEIFKIN